MYFSRLSILDEEPPFIGFEAGAGLRAPGEIFSIRRIERRGVGARTRGNFLRRASRHWRDENVLVRAGRFHFINVRRVSELLAIRRNRVHVLSGKRKRWDMSIGR